MEIILTAITIEATVRYRYVLKLKIHRALGNTAMMRHLIEGCGIQDAHVPAFQRNALCVDYMSEMANVPEERFMPRPAQGIPPECSWGLVFVGYR